MADKTVVVKLQASTQAFEAAMQRASGSVKDVGTAGQSASKSLGGMSKDAKQLAGDMTKYVTIPLVAAGVASVKMASDFDQSFGRMQAIAGVTADQVDGLKDSVEKLSVETGRGPQELADALYFASSAGFDAAQSMDIVNKAAHAAAAGLGSTDEVVQAVTNALGAYGSTTISAGQATDILVAAARDAKIEASQLAPQLGRLLPSAKLLGVGFADVAGAMAFLSQSSGDASLSATQLSGVLQKLLRPSQQGQQALEGVGLSLDTIHSAIQSGGLTGALDLLKEKFGNNTQALGQFFDDAQAYQGAALLLTDNTGNLAKALGDTNNAAGATADAFKKTDGPAREMQQTLATLQVLAIKFGETMLPAVASIASSFGNLLSLFALAPGPVQTALVAMGGLVALSGPIASLANKFGDVRTSLEGMGRAGSAASTAIAAGAKVGLIAATVYELADAFDLYGKATEKVSVDVERLAALNGRDMLDSFFASVEQSGSGLDRFREIAEQSIGTAERLLQALQAGGYNITGYQAILTSVATGTKNLGTDQAGAAGLVDQLTGSMGDQADAAKKAEDAIKSLSDQLNALLDPQFAMVKALRDNQQAQQDLKDLQKSGTATADQLADANLRVAQTALDVNGAAIDLAGGVAQGTTSFDAANGMLAQFVEQGLLTEQQAKNVAYQLGVAGSKADELQGKNVAMAVSVDTTQLDQAVSAATALFFIADWLNKHGIDPSAAGAYYLPPGQQGPVLPLPEGPTPNASGGNITQGDHIVGDLMGGGELVRNGYVYPHAQTLAMMGHTSSTTQNVSSSSKYQKNDFYITAPPVETAERVVVALARS